MPPAIRHVQLRRVALLIEASRAYARELVRGVAVYQREHQDWSISYTPRGLDDPPPDWLRDWEGDGILARLNDRRMADAVARKGVPVIDLRRRLRDLPFPSLGPDDEAVARLQKESKQAIGIECLHSPEIDGVSHTQVLRIAAAAPQPDTTDQQVDHAAKPPQPVSIVPTGLAADASDGREGSLRRCDDGRGSGIDDARAEANAAPARLEAAGGQGIRPSRLGILVVFVEHRPPYRFPQAARTNCKGVERRGIFDHRRVAKALDQLPPDPRVNRSDQSQPQTRQVGRENGDGDHRASQAALPGVLAHDVAIANLLGTADLEDPAGAARQIQGGQQIVEDVFDGDRLREDGNPLGQTMTGSRSTRARISSNERLPEPMMIAARNSITSIPDARRTSPVS